MIQTVMEALGKYSTREREKKERVIEYIDTCLEHLKIIMHSDKDTKNEIEYSRVFLQGAYREIYKALDGVASAQECDIIKKSLMAGRIYFHAKNYGCVTDQQVINDYDDRFNAYKDNVYSNNDFRQNSNEIVLRELAKDGTVLSEDIRKLKLEKIKTVCLEDIERIESLREIIKTRKITGSM